MIGFESVMTAIISAFYGIMTGINGRISDQILPFPSQTGKKERSIFRVYLTRSVHRTATYVGA